MAQVTLSNVKKVYAGGVEAVKGVSFDIPDGGFCVLVGPSGCGKSTLPAHGRRAGDDLGRRGRDRRPRRQPGRAGRPRHRHGVPELCALPAYEHLRQHGLWPAQPRHAEGRDRQAREGSRAHPRDRALPGTPAAPALRRPAPARRHGPRHRAQAAGLPLRRAALEPRRQAARPDARRDQEAAARARRHRDLRHPRSSRGDDALRQARGDECRAGRADRPAGRRLPQAGEQASSRPSSARRR